MKRSLTTSRSDSDSSEPDVELREGVPANGADLERFEAEGSSSTPSSEEDRWSRESSDLEMGFKSHHREGKHVGGSRTGAGANTPPGKTRRRRTEKEESERAFVPPLDLSPRNLLESEAKNRLKGADAIPPVPDTSFLSTKPVIEVTPRTGNLGGVRGWKERSERLSAVLGGGGKVRAAKPNGSHTFRPTY